MPGRKRTTPPRLVDDGRGLRIFRPADRLVEDAAHLVVTPPPPPSRFADDGDGLLVTTADALTAAGTPPEGEPTEHTPDPWQEQRLDAAADLLRWERKLEAGAARALSAWTAVCATAVLEDRYLTAAPGNGLPPDPNAIPPLRSVWQQIAGTHIVRLISDLLGEVFGRYLRDEHVVSARPWQEQYLEDVSNRLVNVADSTFDLVRGVVQDGIDRGADIPTIRDNVQDALDAGGEVSWANRARTIARTETIGAYNGGTLAAERIVADEADEVLHKVWLCLTGDNPVEAVGVLDAGRRWYEGSVVRLRTAQGRVLTVTPDHKVLADVGWRRAQDLRQGDRLLCVLDGEPVGAPQVDHPPALLGEVVDALLDRAPVDQVRRMPAGVDLDVEVGSDRDVEVVRADRQLGAHLQAGLGEGRRQLGLMATDEGLADFLALRADDEDLLRKRAAAAGAARGCVAGDLSLRDLLGRSEHLRLRPGPQRDPAAPECPAHGVVAGAVALAEEGDAGTALVLADELVDVQVEAWSGHVYDLRTVGRWFTSTGIVVHNSTIDPRTRDSHFRADGQRRPLGEPFSVGGHDLDHPGDPTGPASEVINCRCSLLFVEEDEPTPDTSERGFRDAADVQAEIDRRAAQDPPVVRAYDQPADGLTAAAKKHAPAAPSRRPSAALVADQDARFQASYTDDRDELLAAAGDEAQVDPGFLAELLGRALTAAGFGGLGKAGGYFDPNQKRDAYGRWTVNGSGISITVKDSKGRDAGAVDSSFAQPTEALLRVTYEHEFTGSDGGTYSSAVTSVDVRTGKGGSVGIANARGEIRDANGKKVGTFERTIRQTPDGPQAYHDTLALNGNAQGLGLGSELNRRAEEVYRAAGVTHVATEAFSAPKRGMVGGYVWARRGFGWADEAGPEGAANRLEALGGKKDPAVAAFIKRLRTGPLADRPSPFEVSELTGAGNVADGRIGRAALLKLTWNGVRWLPVPDPAADGAATAKADDKLKKAGGSATTSPSPVLRGADADAALARGASGVSDDELEALMDYRGVGYLTYNRHLRGLTGTHDPISGDLIEPATESELEAIADLRAVANRNRLTAPVETWRGMQGAARILPPRGQAIGTVLTDPGFMSLSTDRDVAERFTGRADDSAVLRIIVPAGHPGIPMDALTGADGDAPDEIADEREFVLPPGSSLRIIDDVRAPGEVRLVTAEVLPYGGDAGLAAQEAAVTVRTPRAASTADPAKLTAAQTKALEWVAADWGVNGKGPQPNAGVLRRLADAGLVTDPESGRWRDAELTDAGREAVGLDPLPDGPAILEGADAFAAVNAATSPLPEGSYERSVLGDYMGAGFVNVNGHLRYPDEVASSPALDRKIDALRGMAVPLEQPIQVLRGVNNWAGVIPDDVVGSTITDRGFVSTTTDPRTAAKFADGDSRTAPVLVRLDVPAGTPVIPLDALLDNVRRDALRGESELVLPPGMTFRVTGEERDADGRRVLSGEVLPYAEPAPAAPTGNADTPPAPAPTPDTAAPVSGRAAIDDVLDSMVTEDLEPDAYMALNNYALTGSRVINEYLRGIGSGDVHEHVLREIDGLREAAAAHRLPQPIEVWRGISGADDVLGAPGEAVGTVVLDRGFMSTTTDPAVADRFGDIADDGAIFRLTVPAGHPAVPVDRLLVGPGEDLADDDEREFEVILPPGSSFRVTGDEVDSNGRRVITAEVQPYTADTDGDGTPDAPGSAADVAEAAVTDADPDAPAPDARAFRSIGDGDPAAGDAWLRDNFDPGNLSKAEKEAVGYWTSNNYRKINELLRTGSLDLQMVESPVFDGPNVVRPAELKTATVHSAADIRAFVATHSSGSYYSLNQLADQLDNLPAALDKHRTTEDLSLYRVAGMPELAAADPADLIGATLTDRGFVATSTSPKSAVLVTSEALNVAGPDAVLFEIRTPAGTPWATPELKLGTVNGQKLGGYTAVQEVLLNPSAFRVVDVYDDEVDTSGLTIKNGAKIKAAPSVKRPPTAMRRIVVERVGDAPPLERGEVVLDPATPLPVPETLTPARVDAAADVLGADRVAELTDGKGTDGADLPAVQKLVAEADAVAAAPVTPPAVKITAPRRVALDYYAVDPADRSGKAPNYSVYMPLVRGGLVEKNADGRLVLTDRGRGVHADLPAPEAAEVRAADAAPVEPASASAATAATPLEAAAVRLEGREAFTAFRPATDLDAAGLAATRDYQEGGLYEDLNDGLRTLGRDGNTDPTEGDVNAFLRTGPNAMEDWYADAKAPRFDEVRRTIDAAIADAPPLEQPVTLYRGLTNLAAVFGTDDPDALVGSTLVDHAFMSTTANRDIARLFGTPAAEQHIFARGTGGALVRINTPAGTRALRLGGAGHGPGGPDGDGFDVGDGEAEVLMPRGTALRVSAVSTETLWDGQDWTVLDVDLIPPAGRDDDRDAPAAAPAAPAAPDVDAAGDDDDAAAAADRAAAEKKAAAAARRAAKKAAKAAAAEDKARTADLANQADANGVPLALSYDYLSGLNDDEREDLEVALITGVANGDPLDERRLEDLVAYNDAQRVQDRIASEGDSDAGITQAIDAWLEANGRPGLTHPAVGGRGSDVVGIPTMAEVRAEYQDFLHQQYLAAEEATRGHMLNDAGRRRKARGGLDHFAMFSSARGVADVMQYASDELLDWFAENRRIAWAEFYYERTKSPGYAEKAAKARGISVAIDRDRNALEHIKVPRKKYRASLLRTVTAAARTAAAAPVAPTRAQLEAYAAGRAAHRDGDDITTCPHSATGVDRAGLFVLWVRGYVAGKRAAATAARVAEGLVRHPAADRLGLIPGQALVLPPTPADDTVADRLLVSSGDVDVVSRADLTASPGSTGQTVTAAGSGPGDPSAPEGPPMPRTWRSAPHLAPFGTSTGDGRIFKVGSLEARELPLPLLFQPSSGFGHDGSVVVGRILAVNFTEAGIEASGDYLDADPAIAPDLAKAVEQAVALTEAGLGHVSVDLSDVVGELVDEDGNPVSMEDLFDAWDRGEEPVVLEQVSEGKLIACTQVATPAFEGAKIELSAAPASDDAVLAALEDSAGTEIAVGAVVDVEGDDGTVRGRVTVVDEDGDEVTVQPTDADGADAGDPLVVSSAAVTVVTAAPAPADAEDEAEEALLAAAGPLRPPAAWFEDPKLTAPTAITITEDGRVFGHAALWGACHVGFSNTCVTPPSSPSGYSFFHTGEVVTDDGSRVAVGNLTLGGKHADVRLAYRNAIEHYDDRGAGTAVVRCYEDEFGIAFAGAVTPGTTEEQLYDMRRSPVSGDWRRVGGQLELIGVLSVNSPGFPTPRFATDEAGRTALVAAPSVRPMSEDAIVAAAGGRPARGLSQDELVARVAAKVRTDLAAEQAREYARAERRRRLAGLATSIKADPRARMQALSARVEVPARRARIAELAAQVTR